MINHDLNQIVSFVVNLPVTVLPSHKTNFNDKKWMQFPLYIISRKIVLTMFFWCFNIFFLLIAVYIQTFCGYFVNLCSFSNETKLFQKKTIALLIVSKIIQKTSLIPCSFLKYSNLAYLRDGNQFWATFPFKSSF